jgi:branched-chain amino acid transport system ATP-binding protein
MTVAMLEVNDLCKSFGGVQAIAHVSFAVQKGTATALIGPNGAGKTTLFNLITQIFPTEAGTVCFCGTPITGYSAERIAGMGIIRTFQSARVFPGMTVLENAMVGAHRLARVAAWRQMLYLPSARHAERNIRARARMLLDIVGLSTAEDRPASTLSIGRQKLLEIVRALMAVPILLLLDEPAAGLNDTETAELASMLRAIRAAGVTLLVVEHNMSLVMDVADQIVVLDAGRMIAAGPPDAIRGNQAVIEAYIGREGTSHA